jgi:NAD(P)-dependent dehydrogenase (short-subunit alcohol dehydrogenase family)
MGLLQARIHPPAPDTSFAGKTIIITGASSGLGLQATRQFALLRAHRVILAVRSVAKGEKHLAVLQADPQVKEAKTQLEVFELDLDDYQSVLCFAKRVQTEVKELDILLNNAGMNALGYHGSKSGHERMMQGKPRGFPFLDEADQLSECVLTILLGARTLATAPYDGCRTRRADSSDLYIIGAVRAALTDSQTT